MLHTARLLAALESQRSHFQGYEHGFSQDLHAYRAALARLKGVFPTAAGLCAALSAERTGDECGDAPAGAYPTTEYDRVPDAVQAPCLPFAPRFAHHQDARAWAERIQGTTTLAVDGSQLLPWRDASIPIACIQVGLFENPHIPGEPYIKDAVVEILPPDDLADIADDVSASPYADQIVHLRRLELEVRTIVAACERYAARASTSLAPIVFYDGSLVVSFALTMAPAIRDRYIAAARSLLTTSRRTRIPVIAYIDTSHARDVTTMLRRLNHALPENRQMHDALLWRGQLAWGERTPAFICARGDILRSYGEQQDEIAFVYLQTTGDRPPARLEFPRWLVESGDLDRVLDVVRAEVIAGNGYPYAIEAADAVAVISAADRAEFYRILQHFTRRYGITLSFSPKAISKSRRRA